MSTIKAEAVLANIQRLGRACDCLQGYPNITPVQVGAALRLIRFVRDELLRATAADVTIESGP